MESVPERDTIPPVPMTVLVVCKACFASYEASLRDVCAVEQQLCPYCGLDEISGVAVPERHDTTPSPPPQEASVRTPTEPLRPATNRYFVPSEFRLPIRETKAGGSRP